MQVKTTKRYHLTLVRMAISNKSINKCWQGCGEKALMGIKTGAAIKEISREFPQKIKNETVL